MTTIASQVDRGAAYGPPSAGAPASVSIPDTTAASLLHRVVGSGQAFSFSKAAKVYLATVGLTYLPLFLAAAIGPIPLWTADPCAGTYCPRLLFLHDSTIAFALLVSLPLLVLLLSTDQQLLSTSLHNVESDGVIEAVDGEWPREVERWEHRFQRSNLIWQCAAVVMGPVLAGVTRLLYAPATGFWIWSGEQLSLAGYVYEYCIAVFYAVIIVFVSRSILFSRFLDSLVKHVTFRIIPYHPDKCGGFRPVGRLGLRNQYTLTLLGLNIVLLSVEYKQLGRAHALDWLMVSATVAYLVLGPVVFIGPLLPFRTVMRQAKSAWLRDVAQRLRLELDRVRMEMHSGGLAQADEVLLDRLRKFGTVIEELPVWPFDARTVRAFATAYVVPVGIPLIGKGVATLLGWIGG